MPTFSHLLPLLAFLYILEPNLLSILQCQATVVCVSLLCAEIYQTLTGS